MEAALKRLEGERRLFEEVAHLFMEECPKILAEIRAAYETGDLRLLERSAHSLKGSSANLGAHATSHAAAQLEQQARAGDVARAREILAILEREIALLHQALRALFSEVTN